MRELALYEHTLVSGGQGELGTKLGMGMVLGVTGLTAGSIIGYNQSGLWGALLGAPVGMLIAAVGVPVALIGTGVAVGIAYRAIGFITDADLATDKTEEVTAS